MTMTADMLRSAGALILMIGHLTWGYAPRCGAYPRFCLFRRYAPGLPLTRLIYVSDH